VIIEPPRWHKFARRRFVGGKWTRVEVLRERRLQGRKLRVFERVIYVEGVVSSEVVERMRLAGVVVRRRAKNGV
jgi:hypothetical protein